MEQLPALPDARQGRYDKDVEIFRNGQFFDDRLLHEVLPGDCFCTKERPSLWLKCLTPIKRSSSFSSSRSSDSDPSFSLQGLEVLQAKPTVERVVQPALPPTRQSQPPKRLTYADVDDVDFREQ